MTSSGNMVATRSPLPFSPAIATAEVTWLICWLLAILWLNNSTEHSALCEYSDFYLLVILPTNVALIFLRSLAAFISRYDPDVQDCNFKKAPFLNTDLGANCVFGVVYGWLWENIFCKLVHLAEFLRPSANRSVRQVVFSKRHDGNYLVSAELLAYFDYLCVVSPFPTVTAAGTCEDVDKTFNMLLKFYQDNDELARESLFDCLTEYYGQFKFQNKKRKSLGDQALVNVESVKAPTLEELRAQKARRRESAGEYTFSP